MKPLNLAILISGRGSNMQALVEASKADQYPARPVLILSNRPEAAGLEFARAQNIPAAVVDHKDFNGDRGAFEKVIDQTLRQHNVEMVALAGFMRILTADFVNQWQGRMINIHPSLLPKYPGLDTHARALKAGDSVAGCSVHWVTEIVDAGAVIDQAEVPILPHDTEDSLAMRVLKAEHVLYPAALSKAVTQFRQQSDRR